MSDRNSIKEHAKCRQARHYAVLCPKSGLLAGMEKILPSSIIVNGWMRSDLILSGYTRNRMLLILTFKIETKCRNHHVVIFMGFMWLLAERKWHTRKKIVIGNRGQGRRS